MIFMKFTPTVTVLEGNFKKSQKSPPGAAGGGWPQLFRRLRAKNRGCKRSRTWKIQNFMKNQLRAWWKNVKLWISRIKIHFWYGKRACRQKLIKPMEYWWFSHPKLQKCEISPKSWFSTKYWHFCKKSDACEILDFLPKSALFSVLPPKTINIPGAMEGFPPSARV